MWKYDKTKNSFVDGETVIPIEKAQEITFEDGSVDVEIDPLERPNLYGLGNFIPYESTVIIGRDNKGKDIIGLCLAIVNAWFSFGDGCEPKYRERKLVQSSFNERLFVDEMYWTHKKEYKEKGRKTKYNWWKHSQMKTTDLLESANDQRGWEI